MKKLLLALSALLFLQACGGARDPWTPPAPTVKSESPAATQAAPEAQAVPAPQAAMPAPGRKIKVALLVPLSGNGAAVGEAISNAAQMALFDLGGDLFELSPRDTQGTSAGAAAAAQAAIMDGSQLILGPLLADEVRAVSPVAQAANINVVAFTTDWKQAGPNTFIMGFVPFGQVQRVLRYAATQGVRNVGVIAPQGEYGDAVMGAYTSAAQQAGLQTVDTLRVRPGDATTASAIQKFARSDARRRGDGSFAPAPFQAVFLPAGGGDAQTLGDLMSYYSLDPASVRRLGTGLWDDPMMARQANLNGGWFAAPDPAARRSFEQKYAQTYGAVPPRLASLGYDATALAAVLAKTGHASFDRAALTNPNGFAGIDGIFRFRQDGLAERGLAILELRNGQAVVIDAAPRTFQNAAP